MKLKLMHKKVRPKIGAIQAQKFFQKLDNFLKFLGGNAANLPLASFHKSSKIQYLEFDPHLSTHKHNACKLLQILDKHQW